MFSKRITSVNPSGVREIFELVGSDAINLGLGEPDYDPPQIAKAALKEALDMGMNKYGPTLGLTDLRESIAQYLQRYYCDMTQDNIAVTAGGTEALMVISQTLYDPGDEVLIPEPGFVLYQPHAVLAGANPISYGLVEEKGFQPDIDEIQELVTDRTKAIVVNSPSNPTGGVLSRENYQALVDIATDNDIWIVSDEVYDNYIYEGEHHSFCQYPERSIVVNSFSKSLATTGWRIGYIAAGEEAITQLSKMHYYTMACPPTPIQYAVLKAMPTMDEFLEEVVPCFDGRRRKMVSMLNEIDGFECMSPKGAIFAFPTYRLDMRSMELAKAIASRGVICSPGVAFGPRGEGHLRFSYAASEEDIEKGLSVVAEVVESITCP
jgi:aspartate aminotransferase